MLTKKEWCAVVLMGCLCGMVIGVVAWGVTLAMSALNRYAPGVGTACELVICLALAWVCLRIAWIMERRAVADKAARDRRLALHLCPHCEKLLTLNEYLAHHCTNRRLP